MTTSTSPRTRSTRYSAIGLIAIVLSPCSEVGAADPVVETAPPVFGFESKPDRLNITRAGQPVAVYVFKDPKILRPYFANVHTPDGAKVTRNSPPVPGTDATDHETMHPGVWLGFGELSGHDFWRNKGRIEHVRFLEPPKSVRDRLEFATESRLLTAEGSHLGTLISRISLAGRPTGWLLVWDATFQAEGRDLVFGDQEEMGFGARVATPITEKNGGRIRNSRGQTSAEATWGQPADWCDYSGIIAGRRAGIMLLAAPSNFRSSWWHNRDYGVFVANPFGRAAMKQGPRSEHVVEPGKPLRLRFGALFHDATPKDEKECADIYRDFVNMSSDKSRDVAK
ncbi:DUF6807 family protein [Singulisphaera rosea]